MLKQRKSLLLKSLLINGNDVWITIKNRARELRLEKSDLLYGIYQDNTSFEAAQVFRNSNDEGIGLSTYPLGRRKFLMKIGEQNYTIEFPLTMNSTAILKKKDEQDILASYVKTSWLGKHVFTIPEYGTLVSNQPFLSLNASYTYGHNGKVIGMIQNISKSRNLGRLAILPPTLPIEVRLFILSV